MSGDEWMGETRHWASGELSEEEGHSGQLKESGVCSCICEAVQ